VIALLVSTLAVFALQTVALLLLGRAFYGTPFPPDWGSFLAIIVIGAAAFAALGTATASAIRSAEGSSAVVNFILLPMAFLTGSFGPVHKYPAVLRAIGDVLPLKYFVKLVNAVYLHGNGFWTQPGALAVLGAWGAAGLLFTAFKFRWEPRES
jgi:ABC-2 type transport system permease protein